MQPTSQPQQSNRYLAPSWFTQRAFNPFVAWLARRGISVRGSSELRVKRRTSGEWQTLPVNPLTLDDKRYLVAPRGNTQWVRNLRSAGTAELRVGKRTQQFRAIEVDNDDKVEILRNYLRIWKSEVGVFFEGIGPDATDATLLAIAPGYPVFAIATD